MATATKQLIADTFCTSVMGESFDFQDLMPIDQAESSGRVDGKYIIGIVRGPFFAVNGESLNKRFYKKSLWETAISRKNEVIKSNRMRGVGGHERPYDEETLVTGMFTHRVSKLWIENGIGMGEIELFGTPAGIEIYNALKRKDPLAVSSRAYGTYTGEKTNSGADIIEESSFDLMGFDWVLQPGVPFATPSLVENLEEKEDHQMADEKLNELNDRLLTEKNQLSSQLSEATIANKRLQASNKKKGALIEKHKAFARFALGKIGSANELREAGKVSKKETFISFAKKAFAKLAKFEALKESPEDITAKLALLKEYQSKVGELSDFAAVQESVEKYSKLGSHEDVAAKLANFDKLNGRLVEAKEKAVIKEFVTKLKVSEEEAKEFIAKGLTVADAEKIAGVFVESSSITSRYRVTDNNRKERTQVAAPSEMSLVEQLQAKHLRPLK